jgi:lysyl-tRNA synthetase class 1
MHWVDVIAEELLQKGKEHVIASGTSISGVIHIGNAGDVIMADAIARAINEKGGKAKIIWIMDDVDPLGKLPAQVPKDFERYIGMPVSDIPSPDGGDGVYTDFFVKPFMEDLKVIGVEPEVFSGRKMYKDGIYENNSKKALDQAADIRRILRDISGSEKAPTWLPFDPVCEKCGKVSPTKAYAYDDGKVKYRCVEGVAKKTKIPGCKHDGAVDLRNGKLTWRVEWAARWEALGVTCEPFGKEHSAAGGSYDTSKVIVKEVFGYDPPMPLLYEHIQVDGDKMSSSVGNVLTIRDMLEILPPEVVRYFYFRSKPNKHKDLKTRMKKGKKYSLDELRSYLMESLLKFMDEYEHVERLYFGVDEPSPQEDEIDLKRSYELSQVKATPSKFFQVPYSHLVTIALLTKEWDGARDIIARTADVSGMDDEAEARLRTKFDKAVQYVKYFAPEDVRWELLKEVPAEVSGKLTEEHLALLRAVLPKLETVAWNAQDIHNAIYEAKDEVGVKPKVAFQSMYLIFIGRTRGPRMGYFLSTLEKEFVLARLKEVLG